MELAPAARDASEDAVLLLPASAARLRAAAAAFLDGLVAKVCGERFLYLRRWGIGGPVLLLAVSAAGRLPDNLPPPPLPCSLTRASTPCWARYAAARAHPAAPVPAQGLLAERPPPPPWQPRWRRQRRRRWACLPRRSRRCR